MKLIPKNWRDFQHYKDRNPPWIRLHRGLLDNKDFQRLPVESRALAPMLWLLASESVDGVINADADDLAFRLRRTEAEISVAIRPLIEKGFFILEQGASATLASGLHAAVPEAEAETSPDAEALQGTEAELFGKAAVAAKPARKRTPKEPAPTGMAWNAYATAYTDRYGASPLRNATVNAQLAQFVGRVGAEEAPHIAAWYVGHKHLFYVNAGHTVAMLLRDAEKLRTEWATNRSVTATQAHQGDRTATNGNAFAPLLAKAELEAANAER